MRSSPRLRPCALSLALGLLGVACERKPAKPAPQPPSVEAPAVVAVEHPAQMLPADTMALVWIDDPAGLLDALESTGVLGMVRKPYDAYREGLRQTWGEDMLSPEAWRANGLDPEAPLGLSMTNLSSTQSVVFVGVSDVERLSAFLPRAAAQLGNTHAKSTVRGVPVWEFGSEPCTSAVIRDHVMAVVLATCADDPLVDALASTSLADSLASTAAYHEVIRDTDGAELRAFVDLEPVVRAFAPAFPALMESEEAARTVELMLTQGIGDLGLALTLFEKEAGLTVRLQADDTSIVRALLEPRKEPPRLVKALDGAMLWCAAGRFDPEVALKILPALLTGEDDDERGADDVLLAPSLRDELQRTLLGGWELCLTVDETQGDQGGSSALAQGLGLGLVLDTVDAGGARRLMTTLGQGSLSAPDGDGFVLDTDGMRLVVRDSGPRLVIASAAEVAERLADGSTGSTIASLPDDGTAQRLTQAGLAMVMGFDIGQMLRWLGAMTRAAETASLVDSMGPQATEIPLSPKSKKAQAVLERAHAEFLRQHPKRGDNVVEKLVPVGDAFGRVVLDAREDDGVLALHLTPFSNPRGFVGVLEAMLQVGPRFEEALDPATAAEVDAAEERFAAAQEAYLNARLGDMLAEMPMARER